VISIALCRVRCAAIARDPVKNVFHGWLVGPKQKTKTKNKEVEGQPHKLCIEKKERKKERKKEETYKSWVNRK
jgi:hypothetical protein